MLFLSLPCARKRMTSFSGSVTGPDMTGSPHPKSAPWKASRDHVVMSSVDASDGRARVASK
uniref:Uncharacterized protein n=1 Tax=Arundo donax TaxID=35708 RepID=A0A0A9DX44_ARUDO